MNGDNNTVSGLATIFANPSDLVMYQYYKGLGWSDKRAFKAGADNGIGNPDLGKISTPNTYGVAIPHDELVNRFGKDPAAWRTARVQLTLNGQTVQVPIVDKGPGGQDNPNVITDLTYPLAQGLGATGMDKVQLTFLKNAGADYAKDKDAFYAEQAATGRQLQSSTGMPGFMSGYGALLPQGPGGPVIGTGVPLSATPNPTPLNPQILPPALPVAQPIVPRATLVPPRAQLVTPQPPPAPSASWGLWGTPYGPPPAP